jgi:prepilin peptidase CpaA
MPLALSDLLVFIGVGAITAGAAFTYTQSERIPNTLVYSAFVVGWVFQVFMHPYADTVAGSLVDAALAFAVGFGSLLVFWLFFGMGAGNVKLMGALSIWLGLKMTSASVVASVIGGVSVTIAVMLGEHLLQSSWHKTDVPASGCAEPEVPASEKRRHLIVPFPYVLVAAVWIVLIWFRFISG